MKKLLCAVALFAVTLFSAVALGGCKPGEAFVEYKLSEDGTYYIVDKVSGDKLGLNEYAVPETYSDEEGGQALPVKEIGYEAFYECYELSKITLPETIEKIGDRAFAKCAFSQFIIPESVKEIGFAAFGLCERLTEITVPQSVEKLGALAFYCCSSLEKAVVKANITILNERVFYNSVASQGGNVFTDTALTEIYLPASLQKIEVVMLRNRLASALDGNFLTDIYFAGSEKQWDDMYFFQTVKKEGKEDEYEEKKHEKSLFIGEKVNIHYNVEF